MSSLKSSSTNYIFILCIQPKSH